MYLVKDPTKTSTAKCKYQTQDQKKQIELCISLIEPKDTISLNYMIILLGGNQFFLWFTLSKELFLRLYV